ncbi:MAG TPA: nuclear transport factor 2 family protein [Sphingomicrobium sp.]|nr:nuclear transport factor 2 family protein [Sphingomicrobium sp.]
MTRLLVAASLALAAPVSASPASERAAILATIDRMEAAWNRGDFRGYMAGFKNPDVVFVSGGKFQAGWQGTLDHYIRDYGGSAERRGKLRFYNMKVDMLAPDAAMLIGQYRLVRGARVTEGVNTRLFRKVRGRWLITMNHVSAYDVTPAPSASEAR